MLIAMLAAPPHAVILLMPSVSALITPLGLAQMQMQACVCVGVCVCESVKSAGKKQVKEYSLTKTYPLVIVCTHVSHLLECVYTVVLYSQSGMLLNIRNDITVLYEVLCVSKNIT